MISDNFYTPEKITDHIHGIRSRTGEMMYLIQGREGALLIDTCLGVGKLRPVVEGLTNLPLTVWITHGHVDHAMGAPAFRGLPVYMNHADDEVFVSRSPISARQSYIEGNLRAEPGSWAEAEYVPPVTPDFFQGLCDGDSLDLGGIHAEAYSLPGHTPGTMVVLIPEERILITGDAANNATFLFDWYSTTIESYRENLLSLIPRLQGRYDRCFIMHGEINCSGKLLENVLAVCDDILTGETDDVTFNYRGQPAYIAKAIDKSFHRLDGGEGNIVYSKERVRNLK